MSAYFLPAVLTGLAFLSFQLESQYIRRLRSLLPGDPRRPVCRRYICALRASWFCTALTALVLVLFALNHKGVSL